jgi:hypothetical protein
MTLPDTNSLTLLEKVAERLRKGFGPLSASAEAFIPLAEDVLAIVRESDSNPSVCVCKDASGRTWWYQCPIHGTSK